MKIKPKMKGDIVKVKALAKHDMTTYDQAEKKTGDRENANFITRITASVNGKLVYEVSTSQFLSKNPIFKFQFKGAKKGDTLEMTWVDRKGNTKTDTETETDTDTEQEVVNIVDDSEDLGNSKDPFALEYHDTPVRLFINLSKINDIRRMKKYFLIITGKIIIPL